VVVLAGCPASKSHQCLDETSCDLATGGTCVTAATGNQWCAYPDATCSSGLRYSDFEIGDGLSGTCVDDSDVDAGEPDAGVDATPTACATPPRVAYTLGTAPFREVWVAEADGSSAVNIANSADHRNPRWSPDGQKLVFLSNRSGNWDVWVAQADGTNHRNLTQSTGIDESAPAWSPDGTKIAFSRPSGVWVMSSDGTLPTQITALPGQQGIWWSPLGTMLAFSYREPMRYEGDVYVVPVAAGATAHNLTETPTVNDIAGGWSPDGSRLVFTRETGAGDFDVWTIAPDGTNANNLTNSPSSIDMGGEWSPDGTEIFFTSDRAGSYNVYRSAWTGGPVSPVLDEASVVDISSDGRRLLFSRQAGSTTQVGTANVDGNAPVTFTGTPSEWSPCE
jgi:Tol biopolymer transport system component